MRPQTLRPVTRRVLASAMVLSTASGCTDPAASPPPPEPEPPSAVILSPAFGASFVEESTVELRGTGTDPEDGELSGDALRWTSSLDGALGSGPTVSAPGLSIGSHVVRLVVTDSDGLADTATVSLTIRRNQAPVALITAPPGPVTVLESDTVVFEGSGTDADDGQLPDSALVWDSDLQGRLATGGGFSTTGLLAGTHTVTLTVTDSHGERARDDVIVTVNRPPRATITLPEPGTVAQEGAAVEFRGSATDPEEGPLPDSALVWTSDLQGGIGTGTTFVRSDLTLGRHVITLAVEDADEAVDSATVTLTVNGAPTAAITLPQPGASALEGTTLTFEGSGTDPEDGQLPDSALVWTSDLQGRIGTGRAFSRADLLPGSHTVTLVAGDAHGAADTASLQLTIVDDVGDLFRAAFSDLFGLDVPSPAWASTQPLGPPPYDHRWTGTAYVDSALYRVYITPDSAVRGQALGAPGLLPRGHQRVAVVAIDHGNTNIADVLAVEWSMAQDSMDRDHAEYAEAEGLAAPLVTFDHRNFLAPASEIIDHRSREDLVAWLDARGVSRNEYDILVSLDLDADELTGGFTNGVDFVYLGCYFCTDGGPIQLDVGRLTDIASAVYHHEVGHIWGWAHEWTTCGAAQTTECGEFITAPALFGWTDTDGDGVPEILDATPYGRQ